MPKHTSAVLGLLIAASPALPGADAFSPIDRIVGLATGGFNTGSLDDYEVGEDTVFAPESDGDSDLGDQFVLHSQPKKTPIMARFYSDVFWSNNLASTSTNETSGFYWANTIEAVWRPKLAENTFLDAVVGQDVFIYESGLLNFESTRAALGVIRTFPSLGNLAISARYEFLYSHANNPDFPVFAPNDHLNDHFHRIRIGANRPLFTGRKNSAFVALDAAFDLDADPRSLEKFEYSALVAHSHSFTDQLKLNTFYRLAWSDYRNTTREDWNQIIGIELSYALSDSLRCHTSFLYVLNDSNTALDFDDYEAFQGGLGFGVTGKF